MAFFFSLFLASAEPVQFTLDSGWEWQGTLGVRGGINHEDRRFFWGWRSKPGPPVLGFSSPWVHAGPLSPAGLLREANNPLGFSPQSDVFFERTGLPLDRSLEGTRSGLLFMPIPDVLGFYVAPSRLGVPAHGCFASVLSRNGSGVEGFLSISRPDPEELGDDWFAGSAPFPGGELLVAGSRVRVSFPGFSCIATAGTSRGERVPPGAFWHLRAAAFTTGAYATFLAGGSSSTYRSPRGEAFKESALFATAAGITGPPGSLQLRYSLLIDHPGFAPRPFQADRQSFDAGIEAVLMHAAGFDASLKLKGEKRIARDERGAREDAARYTAAMRGGWRSFDALTGVDLMEPDGIAFFVNAAILRQFQGPRFSLDSRWEAREEESPELTEVFTCRLTLHESAIRVEAGIDHLPVAQKIADPAKHVKLKISWSATVEPSQ
jgi:hypothetical protein